MTQEALKLALDALEKLEKHNRGVKLTTVKTGVVVYPAQIAQEAITAIKEALAQEQEPVANYCKECLTYNGHHEGCSHYTNPPQRTEQEPVAHWSDCAVHSEPAYPKGECDCGGIVAVADYTALSDKYVALKAQRTWQGLTDDEIAQGRKESWVTEQAWQSAVWWAEDKLKEKNT